MLKDEAVSLSNTMEGILAPEPLSQEELKSHQALIVPQGTSLSLTLTIRGAVADPGKRCR